MMSRESRLLPAEREVNMADTTKDLQEENLQTPIDAENEEGKKEGPKKTAKCKKDEPKTVRVTLPRIEGQKNQDEFFSVNFKNYIIQRGKPVDIPIELAEVIRNGDKAKDAAYEYAEEHGLNEPPTSGV